MEEWIIEQGDLKVISTRVLIGAMIGFRTFSSGNMMMLGGRTPTTRDFRRRFMRESVGVG